MSVFINREKEIEILHKRYMSKKAEFIVIYGRRRIGKSELIDQFLRLKGVNGLRLLAREESKVLQLRKFKSELARFFKDSFLEKTEFKDWDVFFEYLSKIEQRLVIAIDEFPYLVKEEKALPSILQEYWDKHLKNSRIFLILCGSSINMMESLMGYKSPLYGRRTGQLLIRPFKFKEVLDYIKNVEKAVEFYSVFGGTPAYLVEADVRQDVIWNIVNKVAVEDSFIYRDVEFVLRQELVEPRYYFSILLSIANGKNRIGIICNDTGLSKSVVNKYLSVLIDLHLVKRIVPVTESRKSKKGLYFPADNMFDFWFRFINPNIERIEKGETKQDEFVYELRRGLKSYIGKHFEEIILEVLPYLVKNNYSKIGKWWHKDKEIDIVALNGRTNEILFAECKWKDKVNARKVLEELKQKAKYVQWHNSKRKERYAVFARSFKEKIKEEKVMLCDLKELERVFRGLK